MKHKPLWQRALAARALGIDPLAPATVRASDPDDDASLPGPRPVSAVAGHFPELPPIPPSRPIAIEAADPLPPPEPPGRPKSEAPAVAPSPPPQAASTSAQALRDPQLARMPRPVSLPRCTECGRPCVGHASLCTYHAVLDRRRERQDSP